MPVTGANYVWVTGHRFGCRGTRRVVLSRWAYKQRRMGGRLFGAMRGMFNTIYQLFTLTFDLRINTRIYIYHIHISERNMNVLK